MLTANHGSAKPSQRMTPALQQDLPLTGNFLLDIERAGPYLEAIRAEMPATEDAGWREVYEQALPYARTVRELAAVIVLDMETRLGEAIVAGGREHGGDRRSPIKSQALRLEKSATMRNYSSMPRPKRSR